MKFTLYMLDEDTGRQIEITQEGVEYLGDLAEVLLNFVQACGYSYVGSLTLASKDQEMEWATL